MTSKHRTNNFKESLFFVVRSTNPPLGVGGVWLPLKLLGLLAISLKLLDFRGEKQILSAAGDFWGILVSPQAFLLTKTGILFRKAPAAGTNINIR